MYPVIWKKHHSNTQAMNLLLQDPFSVLKEYPDTLTSSLPTGRTAALKSSPNGDYIALGTHSGEVIILDYDTKSPLRVLSKHTRAIQSVCWSACGRYLLTASRDWSIKLWDLATDAVIAQRRFEGPVWRAELHPSNHMVCVASLFEDEPVYVDFSTGKVVTLPTSSGQDEPTTKGRHLTLVTTFFPGGKLIISGTTKGFLNTISTESFEIVHSEKITNSNIKHIIISKQAHKMAVNSSDRCIRQITVPEYLRSYDESTGLPEFSFEVEHKYQDVVNKLQWNSITFNHTADFLVASTWGSTHDIYIWETTDASLVKILEGPEEQLFEVDWNQVKFFIASNGVESGTLYLWTTVLPQKWSALAPDFEEVEENIEYEEREDEFDLVDEEDLQEKKEMIEYETEVDVLTKEALDARGNPLESNTFVIQL